MNRHLSHRAWIAALVLVALAAFAACGSAKKAATNTTPTTAAPASDAATTTTAAPKSSPQPCDLVSQAQAEKIVGTPLQAAVKAGTGDDLMCQYTSAPTGPTAQVEVFVGAGAKKNLDIDKDTLKHDFTTLTGIGDEAYLEADNVFVRKGAVWVAVNVVALDAPDTQVQSGLQALASTIAAEL